MPCIRRMRSEGAPELISVFKPVTTFGKSATADVPLRGEEALEFHAELVFDGKDFAVCEAERAAKLMVNGKRKRRSKIFHQDRLVVGGEEFVFSAFDEGQGAASGGAQGGDQDALRELAGMRKLAEFNRRLIDLPQVAEQLEALMDLLIDLCHADRGFVILLEEGKPRVTVARGGAERSLIKPEEQLSDSIVRRVIESEKPLIVSDALRDEGFKNSQSVLSMKLSSVMCVPLMGRNRLLGLIYVGNNKVVSLFQKSDLDVLTIFAGQASILIQNAMLLDQLVTDKAQLHAELQDKRFGEIVGSSPLLVEVFKKVEKVAKTDIAVFVTGETGTGKELIARELHRRSERASGPFVVVNCGAIPENLVESELFGHVRGAFTGAVTTRPGKFQAAHRGTLFLDEVGELPVATQVKLLRAIQEKCVTKVGDNQPESVDIRIVSATNRDLLEESKNGTFREDLFYRLNVVNLHLPPLRSRGSDIVLLSKFLLHKYGREFDKDIRGFEADALAAIRKFEWPGNIRQLENRIKKAVVLSDGALLTVDDLDLSFAEKRAIVPMSEARENFQRQYVLEVLERNNGNRTKTAKDLDVDPRTIFRYLERAPRDV